MFNWQAVFFNWFLALLLAHLRGKSGPHMDKTLVEVVLPSSVTVSGQHGRHTLPRASDRKWERGEVAFVLHHGKERWLLGDRPVHVEPPPETKRGGGAFVPHMPHQPFISLSSIQTEINGYPAFAGSFVNRFAFPDYGWYEENLLNIPDSRDAEFDGELFSLLEPSWHQYFPVNELLQKFYRSALKTPGGKLASMDMKGQLYPQERPYAAGIDINGPYLASWGHWDEYGIDWLENAPSGNSVSIGWTEGDRWYRDIIPARPAFEAGTLYVSYVAEPAEYIVYAYRYRFGGVDYITQTDPITGEVTFLTHTMNVSAYVPKITGEFAVQVYDYTDGAGLRYYGLGIASADFYTYIKAVGNAFQYGTVAVAGMEAYFWGRDVPVPPEFDDDGIPIHIEDGPAWMVIGQSGSVSQGFVQGGVTLSGEETGHTDVGFPSPPTSLGNTFPGDKYESVGSSGAAHGLFSFYAIPEDPPDIPFWGGWPEEPTEESRAEVAKLNPYIYYSLAEPGPFGYLANPHGPLDVESSWCGLSWTTLDYVCDAFYADVINPDTGQAEEFLFGVAILKTTHEIRVHVSKNMQPIGDWPLSAFFPTADPNNLVLTFLDGEQWDGRVQPHYHFFHWQWPFRGGVGYLAPFRSRLRSRQDKAGKHFGQEAADCPLTLYLESYARVYDLEPREYYPLEFQKIHIKEILGVPPEILESLTAPFDGVMKPRSLTSAESIIVRIDLSEVLLPRRFRVKVYVYVKKSNLGPDSYNPTPGISFKTHNWRLAPDVLEATVDIERGDEGIYVSPVSVPITFTGVTSIVRVHAEVRGLSSHLDPLYITTIEG